MSATEPARAALPTRWRGCFSALEAASAGMLLRSGARLETALAAALALRWELAGHSFVELSEFAARAVDLNDVAEEAALRWPELSHWLEALESCPLVANPGPTQQQPGEQAQGRALVCEGSRVYLRRLWWAETHTASLLCAHLAATSATPQRRNFSMLTGGPGTGKTTAAARLVLESATAWRARTGRCMRVALCAPTGKAAARLTEAFQAQLHLLGAGIGHAKSGEDVRSELAELAELAHCSAQTVHRLLGAYADGFQMHALSPLPVDLVLLDEASMLSLQLMHSLLQALSVDTDLVLLGDGEQLSAVESGAPFIEFLAQSNRPGSPLFGCALELTQQWRACGELARAALVMRHGSSHAALVALQPFLRAPQISQASVQESLPHVQTDQTFETQLNGLLAEKISAGAWDALLFAPNLASAWSARNQLRVLCALHGGPAGQQSVNRQLEHGLRQRLCTRTGASNATTKNFPGRLMLALRNDYRLGIMNGDIGLCWPDAGGALKLWFEVHQAEPDADTAGDGQDALLRASVAVASAPSLRAFELTELSDIQPAFAMTVHKAQGSEFERVLLVLPEKDGQAVHKALIYTAITRARAALEVFAEPHALALGIARVAQRNSALGERLAPAASGAAIKTQA